VTLASQMSSDVTGVFLDTEDHAVSVIRRPARGGNTSDIVGVFDVTESEVDVMNGKRVIHKAKLECAASAVIENEDTLTVGAEIWTVHAVGPANVGMKCVQLQRVEQKHQGSGSR